MALRRPVLDGQRAVQQQHPCAAQRAQIVAAGGRHAGVGGHFLQDVAQAGRQLLPPGRDRERQALGLTGAVVRILAQDHHAHRFRGVELQGPKHLSRVDRRPFAHAAVDEGGECPACVAANERLGYRAPRRRHLPTGRRAVHAAGCRPPRSRTGPAAPCSPEQPGQRHAGIGRAHERLADQEGVHACASRMRCTSARPRIPLSVTSSRSAGTRGNRSSVVCSAHLEGAQVAVVDADQRRPAASARGPVRRRRALPPAPPCQAHGPALRGRPSARRRGRPAISRMAVGAHRAGLVDLVRVDHEILAQHRQCARGARLLQ